MDIREFLRPDVPRAFFAFMFMVPVLLLAAIVALSGNGAVSWLLALATLLCGIIFCYLLGCVFAAAYERTQNRWLKILLIAAATVASLGAAAVMALVYIASTAVVCDPVHRPPPIICDPVHQPSDNSLVPLGLYSETKISEAAKQKYQELLRRLG
jgi:hypothetical protein